MGAAAVGRQTEQAQSQGSPRAGPREVTASWSEDRSQLLEAEPMPLRQRQRCGKSGQQEANAQDAETTEGARRPCSRIGKRPQTTNQENVKKQR